MSDYLIYKAIAIAWVISGTAITIFVAWKENRDND